MLLDFLGASDHDPRANTCLDSAPNEGFQSWGTCPEHAFEIAQEDNLGIPVSPERVPVAPFIIFHAVWLLGESSIARSLALSNRATAGFPHSGPRHPMSSQPIGMVNALRVFAVIHSTLWLVSWASSTAAIHAPNSLNFLSTSLSRLRSGLLQVRQSLSLTQIGLTIVILSIARSPLCLIRIVGGTIC
jgi:hypothetical protein